MGFDAVLTRRLFIRDNVAPKYVYVLYVFSVDFINHRIEPVLTIMSMSLKFMILSIDQSIDRILFEILHG